MHMFRFKVGQWKQSFQEQCTHFTVSFQSYVKDWKTAACPRWLSAWIVQLQALIHIVIK